MTKKIILGYYKTAFSFFLSLVFYTSAKFIINQRPSIDLCSHTTLLMLSIVKNKENITNYQKNLTNYLKIYAAKTVVLLTVYLVYFVDEVNDLHHIVFV